MQERGKVTAIQVKNNEQEASPEMQQLSMDFVQSLV
eukprot:CAMPEP_0168625212 /NCGR_PEP_ID=MMETSP0449_2-20121227/9872_1 /TAXON_ID=1082188 /ORGANISM="Strombidium rassoulzadegani, Strain ras09" /LENGTH=35 /DNA_ID= /DNA_START= /DNA_END= /DNA_ORIENTATION=